MQPEELASSLELSKKLKELGVRQDGFFHWCEVEFQGKKIIKVCSNDLLMLYEERGTPYKVTKLCSAFTFTETSKWLPLHISLPHHPEKSYYLCMVRHQSGRFDLFYLTIDNENIFKQTENMKDADAVGEMLIHLMEQGIVKPENHS